MKTIEWEDFENVHLVTGTIIEVDDFPESRNPSYKLKIDLGNYGIKNSSAQITKLYTKDQLLNKQVLCVANFKPKRIAGFKSEVLVTGFEDENGNIVLAGTERDVPDGRRLI